MKNAKNVILNSLSLVLGVLILVFLAMPHYTIDLVLTSENIAGYDLLSFDGSSISVFIDVSLLFMIIFACILILSSICALLANFGVVKGKTVVKSIRFVSVVSAILLALFALFALAGIGYNAANPVGDVDISDVNPMAAGWGVIVNFIVAVILLICQIFNKTKGVKGKRI